MRAELTIIEGPVQVPGGRPLDGLKNPKPRPVDLGPHRLEVDPGRCNLGERVEELFWESVELREGYAIESSREDLRVARRGEADPWLSEK